MLYEAIHNCLTPIFCRRRQKMSRVLPALKKIAQKKIMSVLARLRLSMMLFTFVGRPSPAPPWSAQPCVAALAAADRAHTHRMNVAIDILQNWKT